MNDFTLTPGRAEAGYFQSQNTSVLFANCHDPGSGVQNYAEANHV